MGLIAYVDTRLLGEACWWEFPRGMEKRRSSGRAGTSARAAESKDEA